MCTPLWSPIYSPGSWLAPQIRVGHFEQKEFRKNYDAGACGEVRSTRIFEKGLGSSSLTLKSGAPLGVASVGDPGSFALNLFSGLPKRYDLLAEILSCGQNHRWRNTMVKQVLAAKPARVLDVATGTAGVALLLAENSGATITGLDLSEPMLRQGQLKILRSSYAGRVHLVRARGEQLPFPDNVFDALTFTYLLRYVAEPAAALREMARVVKPGGVMASLEFFVPPNPFWRSLWWLYTRLILPIGGSLGGRAWYEVGRFLGPSISRHYRYYPLPWTLCAWRAAGLAGVNFRVLSLGGGLVMWGRKAEA